MPGPIKRAIEVRRAHFCVCPARFHWLYGRFLRSGRRSSVVERILGKAEVGSSILPGGTILPLQRHIFPSGAHPFRKGRKRVPKAPKG